MHIEYYTSYTAEHYFLGILSTSYRTHICTAGRQIPVVLLQEYVHVLHSWTLLRTWALHKLQNTYYMSYTYLYKNTFVHMHILNTTRLYTAEH